VTQAVSIVIFLNLPPDRFSGKSGGVPDARAHEIQKRRPEARNRDWEEVPRNGTSKHIARPFFDFLASKPSHF
jgi:hypothetical protein